MHLVPDDFGMCLHVQHGGPLVRFGIPAKLFVDSSRNGMVNDSEWVKVAECLLQMFSCV